ncbi:hypothetical protein C8R43DRAFT_960398 [Mycena crocata]|nr:hypothetical protein C8R43DRAFT_960398 [Mycena crocata]
MSALNRGHLQPAPEIAGLFLVHLKTPPGPGDIADSQFWLIKTALRCLVQLLNRDGVHISEPHIIAAVTESWPMICTWFNELYHRRKASESRLGNFQNYSDCPSLIIRFITAASQWPEMVPVFLSSPQLDRVMSILVEIWVAELSSKAKNATTHTFVGSYMESLGYDKGTLAKLLLGHLDVSLSVQRTDRSRFESIAMLIGLTMVADEGLKWFLFSHSSIQKFVAAINFLVAPQRSPKNEASVYFCLKYFAQTLDYTDGHTWVKKALRAKLLPALLACGVFHKDKLVEADAFVHVSRTIPRYLVHRSVLREAKRSLDEMTTQSQFCTWPKGGKFHAAWGSFIDLIDKLMKIKEKYSKDQKSCASPQVNDTDRGHSSAKHLKPGTWASVTVAYLLGTVQEIARKNTGKFIRRLVRQCEKNAKTAAKIIVARRDAHMHSGEDTGFFNYVASHDILLNKTLIVQQRSALLVENPDMIASPFCVLVDYRVVPVQITVLSTRSHNLSTLLIPGFPDSDAVAAHCIEKRGTETYVKINVPCRQWFTICPLMSTTLGAWDVIPP